MSRATRTIASPNQIPLITPKSDWRPPTWAELEAIDLNRYARVGFDTETRDPDLLEKGSCWATPSRGGHVAGVSLSLEGDRSLYIPLAHPEDNVEDPEKAARWVAGQLTNFKGELVGLNLLYDLGWLTRLTQKRVQSTLIDVGYVEALVDENRSSYSLQAIARSYNVGLKNEAMLKEAAAAYGLDPKADLWRMPARFVGEYAEDDAALPLSIWARQRPHVEQDKLERVLKVEHEILPLLLEMRVQGVRVDTDGAEQLKTKYERRQKECEAEAQRVSGVPLDVWDVRALALSCQKLGIHHPRTTTGRPSFTAPWLESHPHPFCKLVVRGRKYSKAARDFCGSMILGHAVKGRIHCSFHPLRSDEGGAGTGRFSSSDPNLQLVPARDEEIGPAIRALFISEEGETWYSADFSSQEPRLGIHYAALMGLPGGAEARDEYVRDPNTDYHSYVAKIVGLPRKQAKPINLGIPYGMGGAKLARELKLPTEWITIDLSEEEGGGEMDIEVAGPEAKAILDNYHARFPFMKKMMQAASERVKKDGFVTTLLGRRRRFVLYEPMNRRMKLGIFNPLPYHEAVERWGRVKRFGLHKAFNAVIQGGSADMMKLSMLKAHKELGVVPSVTVHDELGLSLGSVKLAREVSECMSTSVNLLVPMKVDLEGGPSWGEARKVEDDE